LFPDAWNLQEILGGLKRTVGLAMLYDPLGQNRPETGKGLQVLRGGGIHVHGQAKAEETFSGHASQPVFPPGSHFHPASGGEGNARVCPGFRTAGFLTEFQQGRGG